VLGRLVRDDLETRTNLVSRLHDLVELVEGVELEVADFARAVQLVQEVVSHRLVAERVQEREDLLRLFELLANRFLALHLLLLKLLLLLLHRIISETNELLLELSRQLKSAADLVVSANGGQLIVVERRAFRLDISVLLQLGSSLLQVAHFLLDHNQRLLDELGLLLRSLDTTGRLWRLLLLLLLLLTLLIGCSGARVLLRASARSALSSYFGRCFRDLVVDIFFAVFCVVLRR